MESKAAKKFNIRKIFSAVKNKIHQLSEHQFLFTMIIAFSVEFLIEVLSRHSFGEALMFIFRNPVAYAFGMSIIALTFLPMHFVGRKAAVGLIIFVVWLTLGVINFIVLFFRITPFSSMDISLITSVFSIIKMYLKLWQIIIIVLLIIGAFGFAAYLFIKIPKTKVNIKKSVKTVCYVLICFGLTLLSAVESKALGGSFTNLGNAYKQYGFTYCFSASVFSRGISRPSDYSKEVMSEIQNKLQNSEDTDHIDEQNAEKSPNIIMVQLESFFDLNYYRGIELSQDPIPNFRALKNNCSSGYLTVPSLGAGTANTEFEVLTGMNKAYFGIGEYPYKTILQNKSCESICYNLKESDYSCHAIHNNYAKFYDRDKVFRNLGFDTFTAVENMTNVSMTPSGWAKDEVIPEYIDAALTSTKNRDFVFAITVQGHGKYPAVLPEGFNPSIVVTGGIEDEAIKNQYTYYASMLKETDIMIGELIDRYSEYDEPVMIVFYGDHLPNIDLTQEQLTQGTLFQTEYVIWTNYQLKAEDEDLTSYQLASKVMGLCDKYNGIINQVHRLYANNEYVDEVYYEYMLSRVEYDMLYGDSYLVKDYVPDENLKLGIKDILIKSVDIQFDEESKTTTTTIKGDGFNIWSVVYINDTEIRTVYKNEHTLLIENAEIVDGDIITIKQVTKEAAILSQSNLYIFES